MHIIISAYTENDRGLYALSHSDFTQAIEHFQSAIALDPTFANAFTNLGVAQFMAHRFVDAADSFRQSLTLRPDDPETLLNLGYACWRLDDPAQAKDALLRVIQLTDLPAAHLALGSLYWEMGEDDLAITHSRRGLESEPDSLLGYDTMREVFTFRGDEPEALRACDALIERFPDDPIHEYKRALVMLTYGDPAGWPEWERCRKMLLPEHTGFSRDNPVLHRIQSRLWEGNPTDNLLVLPWGGDGDLLHFCRFLPMAAMRCQRMTLCVPDRLREIIARSFPMVHLTSTFEAPSWDFSHYCTVVSLPYLLDATGRHACHVPYLSVPTTEKLQSLQGMKVGLAWQGSPATKEDHWRSMPFTTMQRLLDVPVHFVSLQVPPQPTPLINVLSEAPDWVETAGLINELDLVITVDTAVAHIAGALGKPVWLLNRYNTDFRWGLGTTATPLYPTMRIFRQPKMGDWESVIEQVRQDLQR